MQFIFSSFDYRLNSNIDFRLSPFINRYEWVQIEHSTIAKIKRPKKVSVQPSWGMLKIFF